MIVQSEYNWRLVIPKLYSDIEQGFIYPTFISTGRPLSLINNLTEIQHLIDGYITTMEHCVFLVMT